MNTFYYFEGRVYETLEEVQNATKNYICKRFDEIETMNTFEQFENEFHKLKEEGNSDLDAIEWAKLVLEND